jgi:hypothetical protein
MADDSTATMQQRNREALLQHEGLDLSGVPMYGTSSPQQDPAAGARSQANAAEEDSGKMRLRSKNKKRAEVKNSESEEGGRATQESSAEATTAGITNDAGRQQAMAGSVVGAVHIPLSLVGLIVRVTAASGSVGREVRSWLPMSTSYLQLVQELQNVTSTVRDGSATCTWLAPLEETLCISTVLSLNQTSGASLSSAEVWDRLCAMIASWTASSGSGLDCRVLAQGSAQERLLQLRLSTGNALCSILALLHSGKAAIRSLLTALLEQIPDLRAGDILVNHQPLMSLERFVPYMHLVRYECTLCLADASAVDNLLVAHARCSMCEASAHICNSLNAVLTALELSPASHALVQCCEFQILRSDQEPALVTVVAKAPVLQAPQQAAGERSIVARKCLEILLGRPDGSDGDDTGAAVSEALATVAALSYVAFLLRSES